MEPSEAHPFVDVQGVSKLFPAATGGRGEGFRALDGVSMSIERGTMMALVGPSGSGKTTLLRCIAGLEHPTAGEITIDGVRCYSSGRRVSVPANRRNVGLIFQNYALWPHMTVARNVEYPLARRGVSRGARRERSQRYLELVGCGALGDRYPHQISGGQQQRVALARTLVYEPALVLFDEPLSNVDLMLREQLRRQIRELQRSLGFTGVFVTHDQGEAFFMGDRVAIVMDGELLQIGAPSEVYEQPTSLAVASFSGATNQVSGRLRRDGDRWLLDTSELGAVDVTASFRSGVDEDAAATLVTRPERVGVTPDDDGDAVVTDAIELGAGVEYVVRFHTGSTWRSVGARQTVRAGATVRVSLESGAAYVYPAVRDGDAVP